MAGQFSKPGTSSTPSGSELGSELDIVTSESSSVSELVLPLVLWLGRRGGTYGAGSGCVLWSMSEMRRALRPFLRVISLQVGIDFQWDSKQSSSY